MFSSLNIKTSIVSQNIKFWDYGIIIIKRYVKITTVHYLDLFENGGGEWIQDNYPMKCCIKANWVFFSPPIYGELVTDLWWIKAPFDLQVISKGIRARVHLNKYVVVKCLFWWLQQIDMKFFEILLCLPFVNVEYFRLWKMSVVWIKWRRRAEVIDRWE